MKLYNVANKYVDYLKNFDRELSSQVQQALTYPI